MKTSLKVKICGLRREEDLMFSKSLGANYFGFILYEKSPRYISFETLKSITNSVSLDSCVFVDVMPTEDKIKRMQDFGCVNFQIHIEEGTNLKVYESYAELVENGALWLAPQLYDLNQFNEALLEFTDTFLIDSYSKHHIGGTGTVGDWNGFKQLESKYPNKQWILAGGLSPDNIKDALTFSEANFIDVNSGIEESPGIKSADALSQLFKKL